MLIAHADNIARLVNRRVIRYSRHSVLSRPSTPPAVALHVANNVHLVIRTLRHTDIAGPGTHAQRHRTIHQRVRSKDFSAANAAGRHRLIATRTPAASLKEKLPRRLMSPFPVSLSRPRRQAY